MANKTNISKRKNRHKSIMEAAIKEFALHGFKGATTQSIAERAKISKQQLHYYIDCKEDLYEQILNEIYDEWVEMELFHFKGAELSAREAITNYVHEKLDFSFTHPNKSKIIANEILSGAPILNKVFPEQKNKTEQAVKIVGSWIERGEIKDIDPYMFFFMIWGATQHFANSDIEIQCMMGIRKYSKEMQARIKKEVTKLILNSCGIVEPA